MYATRQQTAVYDDNRRAGTNTAMVKESTMASTRGQIAQGNNRRALGDIGNLVGALSARCTVSKDALLEIPIANLKQVTAVDRPITRRFGTSLASNHFPPKPPRTEDFLENPISWGAKQRRTMGSSRCRAVLETSDMIGESSLYSSSSVPAIQPRLKVLSNREHRGVAVKKKQPTLTAALLNTESEAACWGFVEVEMEEAEDSILNIDACDVGNQLAVVDYVEDIYSFYRKTEAQSCVSPDYMSRQADINEKMRAILIDWLIEVHLKFKLMPETLFLTTNLIDRYLSCECVLRKNLQLVGVTAMLVASKYEEIWAPEVQDFVFISDNAYTREQVLKMEKDMLNKLKFNLTVPTPYVFLKRFLKVAASDGQMDMMAFFLVELSLTEYVMLRSSPSLLAAAAVYTAQQTLKRVPSWDTMLQRHTGYSEMQLRECASMIVSFHRKAGKGNLTVVHKKYSGPKFHSVASLQPAVFVWEDPEGSSKTAG
eukprot:c28960_g1_i4 orf=981-2432(-)